MWSPPSTKTRTPAIGSPASSRTTPRATLLRSSTSTGPSSGTVASVESWPLSAASIVAPRIRLIVASPSASVVAVWPSAVSVTPDSASSDACFVAVTMTSRGCSGVGDGVGTNGSCGPLSPQATARTARRRRARIGEAGRRGSRIRSFRRRWRVVGHRLRRCEVRRPWASGHRPYCTGHCPSPARLHRPHGRARSS